MGQQNQSQTQQTTGQTPTPGQQPQAGAAPQASSSPPSRYSVTINGKTQELTLDELVKHAQAGLDYEQRAEELEAARQSIAPLQRLKELIDNNPAARAQLATALRAAKADPQLTSVFEDTDTSPPENAEPTLAAVLDRLTALEASLLQHRQAQTITDLKAKYGQQNVDEDALLKAAKELGITDLEAVYKLLTYDQVKEQAVREYLEGKRQSATQPVLPSGPAAAPTTTPPKTFNEAKKAAMAFLRNAQQSQ